MKYILTLSLLFLFSIANASDIIDDVAMAFKTGNIKEISRYFSSTLELDILNEEDTYSSVQAEMILKNFFSKNVPYSSKVIHKVISNANYKFGVIILSTPNGSFRTSYELKNTGGKFLITQIKIEENKE